jgi:Tol biopolymer transport system component
VALRLVWLAVAVLGVGTVVLTAGADRGDAALPGANGLIAYQSDRNVDWDILVQPATPGAQATDLTSSSDGGRHDQAPAWTADGKKILFSSFRPIFPGGTDENVLIMGVDGSLPTPLTEQATANETHPSTSVAGSQIAFRSTLTQAEDIYVMNRDGSNEHVIFSHPAIDTDPNMSPDGKRIAYMSRRDAGLGDWDIIVVSTDGATLTNLTASSDVANLEPDWSPDGSKIVFASSRNGGDLDIFTMNADGNNVKVLLDNSAAESRPAWSPDGKKIAFNSNMDDPANNEIYVMNADGTGTPTRITNSPGSDLAPAWQPLPAGTPPPTAAPPTPPRAPAPTLLTGRLAHNFSFNTAGLVTLNRLSVFDMKRRSNVLVRCLRGCSVSKRKVVPGAGWNLRPLFLRKRIRIPVRIEVRITKPGLVIGRYLRLDIALRNRRVRSQVTECRIAYPSRKITNCRKI